MNTLAASLRKWFESPFVSHAIGFPVLPGPASAGNAIQKEPKPDNHNGQQQRPKMPSLRVMAAAVIAAALVYFLIDWIIGHVDTPADRAGMMFTACLTVFTAIQALFAVRQWQVMGHQLSVSQRSIEQTQDTIEHARQEQRAWLAIQAPVLQPLESGKPLQCAANVKNHGRTPGVIVREVTGFFVDGNGDAALANFISELSRGVESLTVRNTIVAPDSMITYNTDSGGSIILTDELLAHIQTGALTVYILVHVRYVDVFGIRHTTQACYSWNIQRNVIWGHPGHDRMD